MTKLPVVEFIIEEDGLDTAVTAISLVDRPAIEVMPSMFSDEDEKVKFSAVNEEERILFGPAMIPDKMIIRKRKDGTFYQGFFSKRSVKNAAHQFMRDGYMHNMNLNHSSTPSDSFVCECFVAEKKKGNLPEGVNEGSWMVGVKVGDKQWEDHKSGKKGFGFSVEAYLKSLEQKFEAALDDQEKRILDKIELANQLIIKNSNK